jgi:hypothetical protein
VPTLGEVLSVFWLLSILWVHHRWCRRRIVNGRNTDHTEPTRICSGCATEHVADLTALRFLIEQHHSKASARGDGPWRADRLIRVGSV